MLDFIDMFKSDDTTVLTAAYGRDYASVYDAVDRLMTDIMQTLRSTRSDVLIEFRQPYTGPLIRKYGNMLRASDAPNTSILNRQRIVDLRLLSGSTPVHADPIVWNTEEPVDKAAVQLWDTMFGVPQVSMRLAGVNGDHARMLKNYLDYWRDNRGVLLDGHFAPEGIRGNYDLIRATGPAKQIVGLYAPRPVDIDGTLSIVDIVNATASPHVLVNVLGSTASYQVTTTDVIGQSSSSQTMRLGVGPHMIDIPVSGRISLRRTYPLISRISEINASLFCLATNEDCIGGHAIAPYRHSRERLISNCSYSYPLRHISIGLSPARFSTLDTVDNAAI